MYLYAALMALLTVVAVYCTFSLVQMRREAQARVKAIRAEHAIAEGITRDAEYLFDRAREAYADANARWISVIRTEGRIH
jgi:hypothetical protein